MDYKLVMQSLDEGGTIVLEYDSDIHEKMEQALMVSGREDIILCSVPFTRKGAHTMHLISEKYDLTDWWNAVLSVNE